MKKLFLMGALSFLIAACSSEKEYDVAYYIDNPEARSEKLKECANDPGNNEKTVNCVNAAAAYTQSEFSSKNKSMPSIR